MTEHATNLRQALQLAKDNFEAALRQMSDPQASIASFDAVMFECARARRIGRDAPGALSELGLDQAEFQAVMDDVAAHRNVQEHWRDVKNPRKPKIHAHTTPSGLKIAVDETSLIILGPEEIYKGKLNLYDVYRFACEKLAQMKET